MIIEKTRPDTNLLGQDALFQRFLDFSRSEKLFSPGDRVLLAVSGGLDSSVLARLMAKMQRLEGIEVFVGHVDHQKRGVASEKEGIWVKVLASQLNLSFHALRTPANTADNQNAMRDARRMVLENLADQLNCNKIATAHHADDNAETVFMRAISGTGIHGLRGMRVRNDRWIKPLLATHRSDMLDYARASKLAWVEDPSNDRGAYLRNRIRNEVFPLVEDIRKASVKNLARLGHRLDQEEQELEDWLKAQLPTENKYMLSMSYLEKYPKALGRRLLRVWLDSLDLESSPALIEALLMGKELVHPKGSFLIRSDQWLFNPETEFGVLWETSQVVDFNKVFYMGNSMAWSFLKTAPVKGSPLKFSFLINFKDPKRLPKGQLCLEWDRLPSEVILRRAERFDMEKIEPILKRAGIPKPFHKSWPLLIDAKNPSSIVMVVGVQVLPEFAYQGVGRCVAFESLFEQNLSARRRS
ncbi:tRNA lysidine(34) synthetase TilS [bacterium]|nr:tRNA lysidine(34) synthetase TilS [bacterium]